MTYLDVAHVSFTLPSGRQLLDDMSFRVGDGAHAALVGANGTGKTTLLRMIAGDLAPHAGSIGSDGRLGVMRQFIGSIRDDSTVRDLLLGLAPPAVRDAGLAVDAAELAMMEADDEPTQMRYAGALSQWGDAGGYEAEVLWDVCTTSAFGLPFERAQNRLIRTLSGGEQKRLALEALIRSDYDVLLLDEPDNYLDIPGKRWLEELLLASRKTILFVSHDRELLARTADRIVTIEGQDTWVHGGGFATYHAARSARADRMAGARRRWEEEHERLRQLVFTARVQAQLSPAMAAKVQPLVTRLEKFEEVGPPPERPADQVVKMRLAGGRTGKRALVVRRLSIAELTKPFDLEIFYGERIAVLGRNGTGKSHFLRLLSGESLPHVGEFTIGARVQPGYFNQTHDNAGLMDQTLVGILWAEAHNRGAAISRLRRYELDGQADQTFKTLSGGQQARMQILLLEVSGANMLLLDEPTDNLDLASAEALEDGLASFDGTVIAVTHDRWFMRGFDRFVVFEQDGTVRETTEGPEADAK